MTETEKRTEISAREKSIIKHKIYLASKDYMTIREMQGGEPMPAEIKGACALARAEINRLEGEIADLAAAPVEEVTPMNHEEGIAH